MICDLVREPRGDVWERLLRALARQTSTALLVVRDGLGLDERGVALLARLRLHLLEEARASSWPGTRLYGHQATVLRYALNDAVLQVLLESAGGLYAWRHPSLPEDLALLRSDGTVMLGSIAHERDAYLELTSAELEALTSAVPELPAMLRPH